MTAGLVLHMPRQRAWLFLDADVTLMVIMGTMGGGGRTVGGNTSSVSGRDV